MLASSVSAQLPKVKVPLSPFPGRTHYTLALNNALTALPAYDGALAYFPIDGDRIASYDLSSGTLQWIAEAKPRSAPAVGGDLLFLDEPYALTALRTENGSIAWRLPFAESLVAPLAWDTGWLLAVTENSMFAFRGEEGSLVWRRDLPARPRAIPTTAGDRIYLSGDDGLVRALRLDTGDRIWERRVGGKPNEILVAGDRLFVGSTDNFLYCLFTRDGTIDWHVRTGADVVSPPVRDNDRVYFVSYDNVLRSLNPVSGSQQWKRALPFRPIWPPVITAETVIVAGVSGSPRAFALKTGAPAGEMGVGATVEIAAPPHAFISPIALGPVVVAITRALPAGASVVAVSRAIEPPTLPIAPLPGVTPVSQRP